MVKRNVPRKVYDDAYYARNRERVLARNKAWASANPDRMRALHAAATKRWRREVRQQVLEAYGRACACCGESTESFLALDHVNGGGTQHRRGSSTYRVYKDVRDAGFPPTYRLLCHNCNYAVSRDPDGACPHEYAEVVFC